MTGPKTGGRSASKASEMKISQFCDRVLLAALRSVLLRLSFGKLVLKNIDNQVGEAPIFFPRKCVQLDFQGALNLE